MSSIADLDHFDKDPDLAFDFDTDPDPTFYFKTDPDPTTVFDMDPDPYYFKQVMYLNGTFIHLNLILVVSRSSKETNSRHVLLNFPFQLILLLSLG